jgi:hypothetical protein
VEVPADLALVRAAVLTDADVEVVHDEQDVPDGAAALLRWSEEAGAPQHPGGPLP